MKKSTAIFPIFLIILLSCSKKEDISYQSELEKSWEAFNTFKVNNSGNYEYQINQGSVFGFGNITTIEVKNNIVIKRSFELTYSQQIPDSLRHPESWIESESEINTHPNSGAFDAITFDSIYTRAKNIWLKKEEENDYYFNVDKNGLIKECGYITKGCQDDCFIGVNVSYIERK